MKNLALFAFLFFTAFNSTACFKQKTKSQNSSISFPFTFADKSEGQKRIVKDELEHFFENIQLLDVAIQMQRPKQNFSQDNYLQEYKSFLQENVLEFTPEEKKRLSQVFQGIQNKFERIHLHVDFDEIVLIKTTGKGYGSQAFYTRENTIVIPEGQLSISETALNAVMLHELFHIYSRYNTKQKREMYKMIGFQALDHELQFADPELEQRILLNPDGLATNTYIALDNKKGGSMRAVPIIYSTYKDYKSDVSDFFTYLKFDLFQLKAKDGKEIVLSQGVSTKDGKILIEKLYAYLSDKK